MLVADGKCDELLFRLREYMPKIAQDFYVEKIYYLLNI